MKNNKFLIITGSIIIAVLVIGLGFFILKNRGSSVKTAPVAQQDQTVPTLSPNDIGMNLSLIQSGKFANNGVEMKINKISDISSIDYELDYTSKGDLPRGAIGHIDVKPSDSQITQQLPFGTCSDVCHFDQEVKNIKITLKITKKDGSVYQVVSPFSF